MACLEVPQKGRRVRKSSGWRPSVRPPSVVVRGATDSQRNGVSRGTPNQRAWSDLGGLQPHTTTLCAVGHTCTVIGTNLGSVPGGGVEIGGGGKILTRTRSGSTGAAGTAQRAMSDATSQRIACSLASLASSSGSRRILCAVRRLRRKTTGERWDAQAVNPRSRRSHQLSWAKSCRQSSAHQQKQCPLRRSFQIL